MSSAQAPADGATGSGRLVREQSQSQVAAVNNLTGTTSRGKSTTQRRVRRTNLLSMLEPGERRAFLQEQLDQAAIFRQIACAKNGVTGPIERNVIGDMPSDETFQEQAEETGIPEDEIRRREQLARREAMVEVREEVLRRQEEMLAQQDNAAATTPEPVEPTPTQPQSGISEEEAKQREDLARREAELDAKEADVARRQKEAQSSTDAERRAAEQRLEEQRLEAARREAEWQKRLADLDTEAERRRQQEEERLRQQRQQQQDRDQEAERQHQAVMADLEKQRRELEEQLRRAQEVANQKPSVPTAPTPTEPPVSPQPTESATDDTMSKISKSLPWLAALAGPAVLALVGWALWPDEQKPAVTTDAETIHLLDTQGLSAPQTPLGEKILEAFKKDPSLRERVMEDVESTLLEGTTPYQPWVQVPDTSSTAPATQPPLPGPVAPAAETIPTPTPAPTLAPGAIMKPAADDWEPVLAPEVSRQ